MTEPKPTLRERLRRALRGGDVIMANVGAGAQDVTVGKNIVKIGTLVVPTWSVLLTLTLLLGGAALAAWLALVPAKMPPGAFNVAVAEFTEGDGPAAERSGPDSALLSRQIFAGVAEQLQSIPAAPATLVWHDSLPFTAKRASIGPVLGGTEPARRSAACARAQALNAAVLIAGHLQRRGTTATLTLTFCAVSSLRDRRSVGAVEELQRTDRLGGPLTVDLPVEPTSVGAARITRAGLVARLLVGLRAEIESGDVQTNLNAALRAYSDALAFLESRGSRDGADLAQTLVGRVHMLLAQDDGTPAAERPAHLAAAEAALTKATSGSAPPSRALNGLAGVAYNRVRDLPPDAILASPDLLRAITFGEQAIAAAQRDADPSAAIEAQLSLAVTLRLKGEAQARATRPDQTAADQTLAQVSQLAQDAQRQSAPEQIRFRTVAALIQGVAAFQRAAIRTQLGQPEPARALLQQARDQFDACIALAAADAGDTLLAGQFVGPTCQPLRAKAAAQLGTP